MQGEVVRREEQQHRVNDIAQLRVVGRTRAEQGGGHDEEHNRVKDRPRGRAGWMALQEGKAEWNARASTGNGTSRQGRAGQDRTGHNRTEQVRGTARHGRGKGRGRFSAEQGSGSGTGKNRGSDRAAAGAGQGQRQGHRRAEQSRAELGWAGQGRTGQGRVGHGGAG